MGIRTTIFIVHVLFISNRLLSNSSSNTSNRPHDATQQYNRNNRGLQHSLSTQGNISNLVLLGIRAQGVMVKKVNNYTTIPVDVNTTILFFGQRLEEAQVRFTRTLLNRNEICGTFVETVEYSPVKIDSRKGVYRINAVFPYADATYYTCVNNTHQGSDSRFVLKTQSREVSMVLIVLTGLTLLLLSAMFSGLTIGIMALDKAELTVLSTRGTDEQKRHAAAILPLRSRGNLVLCSLIFGNVFVNTSLTLLIESVSSQLVAVVLSTVGIVLVGEIIPQAVCCRHRLWVGAKTVYFTYLVVGLTFPLSYPVAKLLDVVLGDEIRSVYDREKLLEFIKITQSYSRIEEDEMNIIFGALEINKKMVKEIMTPIKDVYMISKSAVINTELMAEIDRNRYSRIPVYENTKDNIVGILYIKDIILCTPEDATPVSMAIESTKHPLIFTREDERLKWVLNQFKEGRCHMAFVKPQPKGGNTSPEGGVIGVVTMEDVLEAILQDELTDEREKASKTELKEKGAEYRRNLTDFIKVGEGRPASHYVSPHLLHAAFEYLSAHAKPFDAKYISPLVLLRLLDQRIYYYVKMKRDAKAKVLDLPHTVYTAGTVCDYFVLIVEGRVELFVGKENLQFGSNALCYFGSPALELDDAMFKKWRQVQVRSRKQSLHNRERCPFANVNFIPDYTVKVTDLCLYMKVNRTLYAAALKATNLEKVCSGEGKDVMQETDSLLREAIEETLVRRKVVSSLSATEKRAAATPGRSRDISPVYLQTSKLEMNDEKSEKSS